MQVLYARNSQANQYSYLPMRFKTIMSLRICFTFTGPVPLTIEAFWHMIWQEGSNRIVMLTKLFENGKVSINILADDLEIFCFRLFPIQKHQHWSISAVKKYQN